MPSRALILGGWLLAFGAFWPAGFVAADEADETVLLVRVDGDDRIALRLRAELRNAQWQVVELRPRPGQAGRSLESLARGRNARAVLRARPNKPAVELWVVSASDPSTGSGELLSASAAHADPGILALRVTEALRARGLSSPPAPAAVSSAEDTSARSAAETAPGQVAAPGSVTVRNVPGAVAVPNSTAPPITTSSPPASGALPGPVPAAPASPAPPNAPEESAAERPAPAPKPSEASPAPTEPPKPEEKQAAPPQLTAAAPAQSGAADESDEPEAVAAESETAAPVGYDDYALFQLELAPALVLSPGDLAASFDVFADLRVQPLERIAFGAFVLAPLSQPSVQGNAGNTAGMRTLAVGAGIDLQHPIGRWQLRAGVGAAALFTWVTGHSGDTTEYGKRNQTLKTAAALARLGAAYRLNPSLSLTARILVGLAIPRLETKIPDRESVYWGAPFVGLTVGAELGFAHSQ